MKKGERTKQLILEQALTIFNERGYINSSMVDVMNATGLERGGIYNHFKNKDDLVEQTFNLAIDKIGERYEQALLQNNNPVEGLIDFVNVFSQLYNDHPFPGGCPIMNVAIEADRSHPQYKELAMKAMEKLTHTIKRYINKKIEAGQIIIHVDVNQFVNILIASLEGSLMISRLQNDDQYMNQMVNHLEQYICANIRLID